MCVPCSPGTHKNFSGHGACSVCPEFSSSPETSTSLTNCTCDPGYVGANGQCTSCETGQYKAGRGDGICSDCPALSSSPEGSEVVEECTCGVGAFGSNGFVCRLCEPGKYKPEVGSDDCLECTRNSFSLAGSQNSAACMCNLGYQGTGNTECVNLNECLAVSTNDCAPGKAACTDTDGSFMCECIEPHFGNGTVCEPRFAVIATSIRFSVGLRVFQTFRNAFVLALADLCNVEPSAVGVVAIQGALVQRRLLSVNSTAAATNVTTVDLVLHVQSLNLKNLFVLLSQDNLNATMVSLGFPQLTVLVSAFVTSECGNGLIEASEVCDDGNTLIGDGCSFQCSVEVGWACFTSAPAKVERCPNSTKNSSLMLSTTGNLTCNSSFNGGSDGTGSGNGDGNNTAFIASTCTDLNECKLNARASDKCNSTHRAQTSSSNCTQPICDSLSTCINTQGSYYCQCFHGFVLQDSVCIDDPGNNATLQRNTAFAKTTSSVLTNLSSVGFGHAISIHRNYLLLGSLGTQDAYLYKKTGVGGWPLEPSYILKRGDAGDGVYGIDVAVFSAEYNVGVTVSVHAVIGTNRNKVYIHQTNQFGRWTGQVTQVLHRQNDLFFGTSVATSSKSVLVGAYGAHKAFLYQRLSNRLWSNVPTVKFDLNTDESFFGHVVAMSEDTVVIGALYVDKIFIFGLTSAGAWSNVARHVLPAAAGDASLGASLSLTKLHLFVGAPGVDKVYIFTKNSTGVWPSIPAITLSKSEGRFGHCVANTDLYAVIGSFRANKAYLFRAHGNGTWSSSSLQTFSQGNVRARSLGFACGITNHDVALSSYQVRTPLKQKYLQKYVVLCARRRRG